ncbi:MAG: hypothetical protein RID07_12440 [Lacipirellulaceae bacterium]
MFALGVIVQASTVHAVQPVPLFEDPGTPEAFTTATIVDLPTTIVKDENFTPIAYCDSACNDSSGGVAGCWAGDGYNWRDTLSLFLGYEGSKQPQDFGVNAHFGGRTAINWGVPLVEDWGLGFQIGSAINASSNAVQVNERVEGNSSRTQSFTTVGLFQRLDNGLKWGVAHDFLYQRYYDDFTLSQWRGYFGYQLSQRNEVGVRMAFHEKEDEGFFGTSGVQLRAIDQGSVYWRHTFQQGAQLGCWFGVAEGHNEPNIALGDLPRQNGVFAYGSDVFCPITDRMALFGEANFLTPADTGTVDAFLGVEIFPWGGARRGRSRRFSPVQSVGGNTSMSVDLRRL